MRPQVLGAYTHPFAEQTPLLFPSLVANFAAVQQLSIKVESCAAHRKMSLLETIFEKSPNEE